MRPEVQGDLDVFTDASLRMKAALSLLRHRLHLSLTGGLTRVRVGHRRMRGRMTTGA